MKRIVLIVLLVLASTSVFAQKNNFYGLKYGEKYSEEQLIAAVGENGEFIGRDTTENEFNFAIYRFNDVKYEGREYAQVSVLLDTKDIMSVIVFATSADNVPDNDMEKYHKDRIAQLDDLYTASPEMKAMIGAEGENRYFYFVGDKELLVVDYNIGEEETILAEAYWSYDALLAISIEQQIINYPTIQDTFFGLSFKNRVYEATVKSAVGYKGNYLNSKVNGDGNNFYFTDVTYAGALWDYVSFTTSPQGFFYIFSAYNCYDDYGYDDRNEAENKYTSMKKRLDEKYGEGREEIDGYDRASYYNGNNNVCLILKNTRSKSQGGTYKRYVEVTYCDTEISEELSKSSDEEL